MSVWLPVSDLSLLRALSKKMGWSIRRQKKSKLDIALEKAKAGKVYEASSVENLIEQLED